MSASGARKPLLRRTQIYVTVIVALGLLAVGYSVVDVLRHPIDPRWLRLAFLCLLTGWLSVKLPTVSASISISETFVFAGTLLFGPSVGTVLVLLDVIVLSIKSQWARRGLRWEQTIFNLATPPLSLFVAARLAGVTGPVSSVSINWNFVGTLAAFTAMYFLLNSWIVSLAIASEQKAKPFAVWWHNFRHLSLNFAAGASIAAFLVNAKNVDFTLVGVIIPLLFVIYLTYSWSSRQIEAERHQNVELNRVFLSTIEALALAIDAKDQVTHGHIRRVQKFTMALADALGVTEQRQLDALRAAALLHDTGKLAVPEYILNKPGPLTSSEFERMKVHAAVGADILKSIEFPYPVEPIVRHHHENWDGSGYPEGLRGHEIPLGARILSVVDCYDAITSDRPYRPRMTRQEAEQVLRDRRGSTYDPLVVDAFLQILDKLDILETTEASQVSESASIIASVASSQLEVISATTAEEREFNELRRELPKATSVSTAAEVLFRYLRRVVPAASFALYVPRQDANELSVLVSSGVGAATIKDIRMPIGERISGWVFAHKQAVLNSDATLDLGPVVKNFTVPLKYALAVPMLDGGPIAVITLYGEELFDKDHRRILEGAASLFMSSVSSGTTQASEQQSALSSKRSPDQKVH